MDTEISFYLFKFNISLLILRHFVMSVFATSVFYFEGSKNIYVKIFARISYGIPQYWVIPPSTNCLGNKKESCSLTWLRECVGKSEYHRIQLHFLLGIRDVPNSKTFTVHFSTTLHSFFLYVESRADDIMLIKPKNILIRESMNFFFLYQIYE